MKTRTNDRLFIINSSFPLIPLHAHQQTPNPGPDVEDSKFAYVQSTASTQTSPPSLGFYTQKISNDQHARLLLC